jgi:hypothetical protein
VALIQISLIAFFKKNCEKKQRSQGEQKKQRWQREQRPQRPQRSEGLQRKEIFLTWVIMVLSSLFVVSCVHYSPTVREKTQEVGGIKKQSSLAPSKGVKTRGFVSSFTDGSQKISQEVITQIQDQWLGALEKGTDLIVITEKEMTLPETSLKERASLAFKKGIFFILEPKIVDIQISGKKDPVGIIRRSHTEMVIKVQLKVLSTRDSTEVYHKIKTLTIEDSQVRVADSTTAEQFVLSNPSLIKARIQETLFDYIPEIQQLLSKIQWEGRVALVQGDRIYLNVGQQTGVRIGDILRVSDVGEEIYDPQSGEFIGRTAGRVKGTIEILSYFGEDGSVAALHSGSGFRENDRVELQW